MLSRHCYYVYHSQAATVNLACCPDFISRSSGTKKPQFRFPSILGKTSVSVLKTVTALHHNNDDNHRQTGWHQLQDQLGIGNVAASMLVLTHFKAHGWVRARHLIYNRWLCQ